MRPTPLAILLLLLTVSSVVTPIEFESDEANQAEFEVYEEVEYEDAPPEPPTATATATAIQDILPNPPPPVVLSSSTPTDRKKKGFFVSEDEWHAYWPPKKPWPKTGYYTKDQEGHDEWLKDKEAAIKKYESLPGLIAKYNSDNRPGIIRARPYPFCVDGYLPMKHEIEPALKRYVDHDLFRSSQPANGTPTIRGKEGKGPLIHKIKFHKVKVPPAPEGIGAQDENTNWLRHWYHIYIVAKEPLEGLLIQAIGYPMGLPFGEFRNDFDCDMSGEEEGEPVVSPKDYNPEDWKLLRHLKEKNKTDVIVPCKYPHANLDGDHYPTVFAYGGYENPDYYHDTHPLFPPRKTFRTYLNWANAHCNYKFRVQFLILAVKSFDDPEYDTFLTPNYLINLHSRDGVPTPYTKEWDGRISCNQGVLVQIEEDDPAAARALTKATQRQPQLMYHPKTSDYPLVYDGTYDQCITGNVGLDAAAGMVCPPKTVCMNSQHPLETVPYRLEDLPGGRAGLWARKPEDFFNYYRSYHIDALFVECAWVRSCPDPEQTMPVLKIPTIPDERFTTHFMEEFFGNTSQLYQNSKGTHGWTMIFSWFILFTIGIFTARFYKETGGIREDLSNACLGIGYWFWVHVFLLLLCGSFMWIGVLEVLSIHQTSVSCNLLSPYNPELETACRNRKQIIKLHRDIGFLSVAIFHAALLLAWARPMVSCGLLNCRTFFIWGHAIFGYLGKLACIASVLILFSEKAVSICKDFPITVLIFEGLNVLFYILGVIFQYIEDKREGRSYIRWIPIQSATEALAPSSSTCYTSKVILIAISCTLHLALFSLVLDSASKVYETPGINSTRQATYEVIQGNFGTCKTVSAATQVQITMNRYFYAKDVEGNLLYEI